jgi:hypothetical protein
LKPERWGSLLVQEKYREEKACDKRQHNNTNDDNDDDDDDDGSANRDNDNTDTPMYYLLNAFNNTLCLY